LDVYKHKREVLRDHCEAVGRPFEDIRVTWAGCIATAEKEEEARKIATTSPHITKEDRFDPSDRAIVGTPPQVAEQIGAFVDLGVDYFIFRFLDFPSTAGLELFANQVMGSFR
jgi:alkanesulfonate monooxygenase SsuD/methylene tetrahydromethanopterin reductase-like flavin-dependent oxidoreductase (luciferase family)